METVAMKSRAGFTLIEVIVAMVLLAVVGLAMGAATARVSSVSARASQVFSALDLVNDRLGMVQADPSYRLLESRYVGSEAVLTGFPGLQRATTVQRVYTVLPSGRVLDYKLVEVTVSGSGLLAPVSRAVKVGAP